MAQAIICDICEAEQAVLLIHNTQAAEVYGLGPNCAAIGLRALADTLDANSDTPEELAGETPDTGDTDTPPAGESSAPAGGGENTDTDPPTTSDGLTPPPPFPDAPSSTPGDNPGDTDAPIGYLPTDKASQSV